MDDPAVLYDREPPWAWVRLNRPQVHNAFNVELRDGLHEALGTAEADPEVLGVAILGEGPSFGTGGDLREFSLEPRPWRNKLIRRERDVWGRLLHHRCLTAAAVHGNVAGSGLELALYCDLRLADPESRWLLPETGLGMIPGAGGTQLLPRLVRPGRALKWMLAGESIDGREAHRLGLAQALIPAAERRQAAREWFARRIDPLLARDAGAVLRLKALLRQGLELPLERGLDLERLAAHGRWGGGRIPTAPDR
ncbi:MAG: enoyl-CoA hydratase/isomerase family protein [bacterium]